MLHNTVQLEGLPRDNFLPISPPVLIFENLIFFFCVKDCIADMATITILAKILSLKKAKIAGLGKNFIPQKCSAIWYYVACIMCTGTYMMGN